MSERITITRLEAGARGGNTRLTDDWQDVSRDVATEHPDWIHFQCGTDSEAELQAFLGRLHVDDYYAVDGSHRGPDGNGVAIYRD